MNASGEQELLVPEHAAIPIETPRKRRRITNPHTSLPLNDDRPSWLDLQSQPPFLPPADPLHSPAAGGQQADCFSPDSGFLASQEELRCILFSLAHSAIPTGATSPDALNLDKAGDAASSSSSQPHHVYRDSLRSRRRIEYLKNYVAEVAPWVSVWRACILMCRDSSN